MNKLNMFMDYIQDISVMRCFHGFTGACISGYMPTRRPALNNEKPARRKRQPEASEPEAPPSVGHRLRTFIILINLFNNNLSI